MNPTLEQALIGPPVTVKLGGKDYPLAYPMQAVILYQKETAALDRERNVSRWPKLEREELRDLRRQRRALAREIGDLYFSHKEDEKFIEVSKWPEEDKVRLLDLREEGAELQRVIDEAAQRGDSLCDRDTWHRIGPQTDPERFLLALWVGLHRSMGNAPDFDDPRFQPQVEKDELSSLIHPSNSEALVEAIVRALTQQTQVSPENLDPNARPSASPTEMTMEERILPTERIVPTPIISSSMV